MTSQPGSQTVTMHILPNTPRSKGNQTMRLGQLIEYNKRNIFLQKYSENEALRLVSDLFLCSKKALYKAKVVWNLVSISFDSSQLGIK